MARIIFLAFFIAAAILELIAEYTPDPELRLYTKPLLMPSLILFYIYSIKIDKLPFHMLLLTGFLFSWMGDIALMFTHISENYFLGGLVAFLIAHLCYIGAFCVNIFESDKKSLLRKQPLWLIPFAIFFVVLMVMVWPTLGDFRLPVFVYGIVITAMVVAALNRHRFVNYDSFILIFWGALLFLISDTFIAINRFLSPFDAASVVIMSFYIVGQYFIALGGIRYAEERMKKFL